MISTTTKYRLLVGNKWINWLNRVLRPANWFARLRTPGKIQRALGNGSLIKINIGCGRSRIDKTWLHADINHGDIYTNALKRLPFPDNTVDLIFSEHFIEHLPEKKARRFWSESFRVLKPGGWMRHSTPGLDFYVKLYLRKVQNVDLEMFYQRISHIHKVTPHPCIYMNEVLTYDDHKFIYDEQYLRKVWIDSGFQNVKIVHYGESDQPELTGLEQHSKTPWYQNDLTLIMESQKPLK